MEIKNLTVAIATFFASTNAFAFSEPSQQVTEIYQHHAHQNGNDRALPDNGPTKLLPQQTKPTLRTLSGQSAVQAANVCDVEAFTSNSSNDVLNAIKNQGVSCVSALFSAESRIQESAFESGHMYNIAKHTTNLAKAYAGGGSDELEALFLYLRAGYYAEFYNSKVSFVSWVTPAVKEAIDAFVNNAKFFENSDPHGKVLSEVIFTMDSAGLQHAYLPQVTQWLTRWDSQYAQNWYMRNAVNGVFTILYRGQWNEQFLQAIGNQTQLVKALGDFALRSSAIGSSDEFMAANAGRELGRLTKYSGSASNTVKSKLTEIFAQYEMYGRGDAIWLGAADTVSYNAVCSDYGICNFKSQLKGLVLSQSYTCSPTVRILSQNMTQEQHVAACSKMGYEEGYFHTLLETGRQPVADDYNTQLQVNIFDSSDDYVKYARPIFNISTNNGGMYLEGDPATPGNIPNFVAYEAPNANPDHFVWNLEHEYVHYLDGRFNLYGGFGHPTERIVWWSEGIAEYVSKENDNRAAIDTIKDGSTFTLSEIFETSYDNFDVDRIYRWGYLAVRFMFERHKDDVNQMLIETRQGNWANYKATINQWGILYQGEFEQWQQGLVSGDAPNGSDALPQDCAVQSKISGGRLTVGQAACLATKQPIWLGGVANN